MKSLKPTDTARLHPTIPPSHAVCSLPRRLGLAAAATAAPAVCAASELDQVSRELQERLAQAQSEISLGLVLVWLVVGALVGSLAGMLFTRKRAGFGALTNLLVGLCGAGLGGWLFNSLDLHFNWGAFVIHYQDLFSAFLGSLILLLLVWLIKRGKGGAASKSAKH